MCRKNTDAGARARTFRRDDDEGLGRVERAFELDRSARIGRVPASVHILPPYCVL